MKNFITGCITLFGCFSAIGQQNSLTFYDIPVKPASVQNSFNTIENSLVTIPIKGGIYELTYKTWLISPEAKLQIVNYDVCRGDTSLLLALKKDSTIVIAKGKNDPSKYLRKTFFTLPYGYCQVTSMGLDSFFVWHYNREGSTIYYYSPKEKLKTLLFTKDTITALYPVTASAIFFATGPTLFSLSPEGRTALKKFPADIDGITQDDAGRLLVSTFKGIYVINPDKKIGLMTDEFHGLIKCDKNELYVLDRTRNKIVKVGL